MNRDWITTVELADILGHSERYIRKAIYQGKLPSFKEGRYHRIPISALREDWQLEAFKILEKEKFIDRKSNLPTVYTEENKKKEHYDLWVFSREGSKALREKVVPYIKRDPSKLEVGDVLVGDGHRLAFQVINPFDGKPCRPTLVGYQDWKSGGLVGFEIMLEENTQ